MIRIEHCPADVPQMRILLKHLRPSIREPLFSQRLARAMEDGYTCLGAFGDARILGGLGYHIAHDVTWGATLYIDDLVVHRDARGKGIGAALMDAAKTEAQTLGCDHLRLCSGLARRDAHRFYEHCGLSRSSLQFTLPLAEGSP